MILSIRQLAILSKVKEGVVVRKYHNKGNSIGGAHSVSVTHLEQHGYIKEAKLGATNNPYRATLVLTEKGIEELKRHHML